MEIPGINSVRAVTCSPQRVTVAGHVTGSQIQRTLTMTRALLNYCSLRSDIQSQRAASGRVHSV